MWSIIPAYQAPKDLDVSRAEAKARSRLDAHHEEEFQRKKRRSRKRDATDEDVEMDTFEPTVQEDHEE